MTQRAALCQALLNGEKLSIMDGFKKFGITNLPREISRGVEKVLALILLGYRKIKRPDMVPLVVIMNTISTNGLIKRVLI
jgi:hypothetical protein